jgi:hypothetical protein
MATVLSIDSDDETVTAICRQYREANVYAQFDALNQARSPFVGPTARRELVESRLLAGGIDWITGSGHGFPTRFTGQERVSIFETTGYDPAEVAGRIIHLLACETAATLGTDLVSNGCVAFFGYDEVFVFPDTAPELFLDCDATIDLQLADGKTAQEAYDAAFAAFNRRIAQMQRLGKIWIAAALARNRDHLCAPSIDSKWGDAHARIT